MIRAGLRADKRQQGMIAGSHFSSLCSLSLSPWPPRENLPPAPWKSHLSSVLSPHPPLLSKKTFLMKSFIRCAADCCFCEAMHKK